MAIGDEYFTFPRKRDPDAEAEWDAQSLFEAMEPDDWDTAGEVDLPPELEAFQILAEADGSYASNWGTWMEFAYESRILVPIEQSCESGLLLPTDQRALRLVTCPEEMLKPLRKFFEGSPRHVKLLLCHYIVSAGSRPS